MKPTADELLVAIRAHCLECSGGSKKEVDGCLVKTCKLRKYRSVSAINEEKQEAEQLKQVSLFDLEGENGKIC